MTEHDLKVERQRTLIKLEKWRKEIKMILDEKKDPEKPWQFTITYNDDSQVIEWSNSNHKQHIPSPHSEEDLISMKADEHEYQRKIFNQKRRENNGI